MVVPLIGVELKIKGFGEKLLYKRLEVHPSVQHVLQAAAPRLRKSRCSGAISHHLLAHVRSLGVPYQPSVPFGTLFRTS